MRLPTGAKKDFLVILFCHQLILASTTDEFINDDDIVSSNSNKDYKQNKRLRRSIDKFNDDLLSTINSIYETYENDFRMCVHKNLNGRVGLFIKKVQHEKINLESLAYWILYINFSEVERPLHEKFIWLKDGEQFLKLSDTLRQTSIGHIDDEMWSKANECIEIIKA